jgi:nicotinamidase-related amidase
MKTEMYCYLPDGSRKPLPEGDEALERWLEPEHSAVVCIDMHRGHVGPEEALPCPAPRARERIGAHNRFHTAARDLGVPVIHVQHWQRHGGIDDLTSKARNGRANWRVLYPLFLPPNPLTDKLNWEGTKWLDLMVEEDPERDYYVRSKKRLSAFYPTDLEFLLRQLDVYNVVLTGTLTDCCVINSAFDAANRDFRVVLPRDVTGGISEEAERWAFGIISMHAGLVVDSGALVAEWSARAGRELPAPYASPEQPEPAPTAA